MLILMDGKIMDTINAWIAEKEQKMFDSMNEKIMTKLGELGLKIWDGFIHILPDIVGLGACAIGGFLMISPMIGQSPVKVLGWGTVGFVIATSLLINF